MPAIGIIPALIAAGGAVGSAAVTAHAASRAAQQEQQGAQNALNLQTQLYNQTRQDYAPYRQVGASVLPQLAAYAGAPVVQHNAGRQGYSPGYQPGMTLGGMLPAAGAGTPPGSAGAAASPGQDPQTVTLKSPTGQLKQFAANDPQVQHYLQMGATRV